MAAFRETKFRWEVLMVKCSKTPYPAMSSWFKSGLEEGQKSAGQKSVKFVLQYCHTFFTVQHLTGSWVFTYLLLRVAGFQPAKKKGTTGPYCTPQPLLSSQAWKPLGGHLLPLGVMTPRTMIWAVCCVQMLPLTSSIDLARYLSIYLLTNLICCVYFLIGENFHIYKIHLDLGIISLHFFCLFDIKTTINRCLRILTNDSSPKRMITVVLILLRFTFCWFTIFLKVSCESCSTLA